MSVEAASIDTAAATHRRASGRIYLFMAVGFLCVAIVGFAPRTIATLAGEMPVPRPIVHVHAVLMGAWLLIFLAQTGLMATGRRQVHQRLGVVSLALAPAIVGVMLAIMIGGFGSLAAQAGNAAAGLTQEQIGRRVAFLLFVQGRAALLFGLFVAWALLARRSAPETHKRMMVMATFAVIDAAIGRMAWLPGHPGNWVASAAGYDALHLYHLLLIAPAVGYDLFTRGRVHRAYVAALGLFLVLVVATHVAWNADGWHAAVTAMLRASG